MAARILILHAYSAENLGDGLLVRETIRIATAAFPDASFTVVATRPETFAGIDAQIVSSRPRSWRELVTYLRVLRSIDGFDAAVGVGGGYLRFGHASETVKTVVAHLPQLVAAAHARTPTVYLAQSVGPAGPVMTRVLRRYLSRLNRVYLRDDRSVEQFPMPNACRVPDLALIQPQTGARLSGAPEAQPVLSVRALRGKIPAGVTELARSLQSFDGYIQSVTGGNDDTAAMTSLHADRVLSKSDLLDAVTPRVVVAVRLHAALMAIAAGHYVVHLAYERKGFGAFADLGLPGYVHSVNHFDPRAVQHQVDALRSDEAVRAAYRDRVAAAFAHGSSVNDLVVGELRSAGQRSTSRR